MGFDLLPRWAAKRYSEVPSHEDSESFLKEANSSDALVPTITYRTWQWSSELKPLGIAFACLLSCFLSFLAGQHWPTNLSLARQCVDMDSHWSPVTDDVKITYHEKRFNTSLLKPSIYRADPGYGVDEAWIALGVNYGSIGLTDEEAVKSGISTDHARSPGYMGSQVVANVEVFHQLHCLNVLRETNHYYYPHYRHQGQGPFENRDEILKLHAGHCLDMIRQRLMCTADTGLVADVRIKGYKGPYPDFDAVPHKCKNFEDIQKWAYEHQLPGAKNESDWWVVQPGERVHETIFGTPVKGHGGANFDDDWD